MKLQGRTLLGCCIAALIGFSLALLPVLPYLIGRGGAPSPSATYDGETRAIGLASIRHAVEVNEGEHAGESVVGNVPWYHLPLIVVVGLVAGLGAYFRARSYPNRTG